MGGGATEGFAAFAAFLLAGTAALAVPIDAIHASLQPGEHEWTLLFEEWPWRFVPDSLHGYPVMRADPDLGFMVLGSGSSIMPPWLPGVPAGHVYRPIQVSALALPNDEETGTLGLAGTHVMDLPAALDHGSGSTDVLVCVVDSGARSTHPDFGGRIIGGYDVFDDEVDFSDDNGHGTHVAGIAAAEIGNAMDIHGHAEAALYIVDVMNAAGNGPDDVIGAGIKRCVDDNPTYSRIIINLSLGATLSPSVPTVMKSAVEYVVGKGALVVAATGNSGGDGIETVPAGYDDVLGVACSSAGKQRCSFLGGGSDAGAMTDISAFGDNVVSLDHASDDTTTKSGTSMATPQVAGAAALAWSLAPSLTAAQLATHLTDTAEDLGATGRDDIFGHGMLDVNALVQAVKGTTDPAMDNRIFFDDFETGFASGWSFATADPGDAIEWHRTSTCGPASTGTYLRYGSETACDYDSGATDRNIGWATFPVDLTTASRAQLGFDNTWVTQDGDDTAIVKDAMWVCVATDGSIGFSDCSGDHVISFWNADDANQAAWDRYEVPLNGFVGQSIIIGFVFDTGLSVAGDNDFAGWMLDNVAVDVATVSVSTQAGPVAKDDGDSTAPIDWGGATEDPLETFIVHKGTNVLIQASDIIGNDSPNTGTITQVVGVGNSYPSLESGNVRFDASGSPGGEIAAFDYTYDVGGETSVARVFVFVNRAPDAASNPSMTFAEDTVAARFNLVASEQDDDISSFGDALKRSEPPSLKDGSAPFFFGTTPIFDADAHDSGQLSPATGSETDVEFTPATNYCSNPTNNEGVYFQYEYKDSAIDVTGDFVDEAGIIQLKVTCVNDAPVAVDDNLPNPLTGSPFPFTEGPGPFTISTLLANDQDVDASFFGDNPEFKDLFIDAGSLGTPSTGSVVRTADGKGVTYTPPASDYCNEDSNDPVTFTYKVRDVDKDGAGASLLSSNEATVRFLIECVNDDPVAGDFGATLTEDTANHDLTIPSGAITDPDGETPTIISAGTDGADGDTNKGGTIVINGQALRYSAPTNYCSDPRAVDHDTFSYVVQDAAGATDTGLVTVTLECKNDPPEANADDKNAGTCPADRFAFVEDSSNNVLDVLCNDGHGVDQPTDFNPIEVLSVSSVATSLGSTYASSAATSQGGSVSVNGDADRVLYTPPTDFVGTDTFCYEARDRTAGATEKMTDTACVTVTVGGINDAPVLTPFDAGGGAPANTGQGVLATIDEDFASSGGYRIISGILGNRVSDADDGADEGVAFFGADRGSSHGDGDWEYRLTNSGPAAGTMDDDTETTARLLHDDDNIRFLPDGKNGGTFCIDYRAWDRSAGTAGQTGDATVNGGSTAYSTQSDTLCIQVTDVNDAPTWSAAVAAMTGITEDEPDSDDGTQVSNLLDDCGYADVDLPADARGIAVVASSGSAPGEWQYSTNGGGTWTAFPASPSDSAALLLEASHHVRFRPDEAGGGTAIFDARAWDRTDGQSGAQVHGPLTHGGSDHTAAYSGTTCRVSLGVTDLNDAPVLVPFTDSTGSPFLTISEDDIGDPEDGGASDDVAFITISSLLGSRVTDADQGALQGVAFFGVTTVSGSGTGTWQFDRDQASSPEGNLDGRTEDAAQSVPASGVFRFAPDAENGGLFCVSYVAWDQTSVSTVSGAGILDARAANRGGTNSLSTDEDQACIQVTAANDAPTWTASSMNMAGISEDEADSDDGSQVSVLLDACGFGDVDLPANSKGIAVVAKSATAAGEWQRSTDGGSTWTTFPASLSDGQALLLHDDDHVRFRPDGTGGGAATLDARAWDRSNGASTGHPRSASLHGGIDHTAAYSGDLCTINLAISGINDAPELVAHDAGGAGVATTGKAELTTISEDDALAYMAVSAILGDRFSDADGDAAGVGFFDVALDTRSGIGWRYQYADGFDVVTGAMDTESEASARLLRAAAGVGFLPDAKNGGVHCIDYRAWDQTVGSEGATADATKNGGTHAFSVTKDTLCIRVTDLNDQPAFIGGSPTFTGPSDEDDTTSTGMRIEDLVGPTETTTVSDVDLGATYGIVIEAFDADSGGTWQFGLDCPTDRSGFGGWEDVPAVSSGGDVLHLRAGDCLRFVPNGENGSDPSFTMRAWDQTKGPTGSVTADRATPRVAPDFTDHISAYGADSLVVQISVGGINDPPSATDGPDQSTTEDPGSPLTFDPRSTQSSVETVAADSDPDGPDDQLTISTASLVAGYETTGTLVHDATTITFTPSPDYCNDGVDPVRIHYQVRDSAGDDSNVATVEVTVTCVNDPPRLAALVTGSILEDATGTGRDVIVLRAAGGGFAANPEPVANEDGETYTLQTISSVTPGALTVDDITILAAAGEQQKVRIEAPADFCGLVTFDYTVVESTSSGAPTGQSSVGAAQIDIVCVNDAPEGQNVVTSPALVEDQGTQGVLSESLGFVQDRDEGFDTSGDASTDWKYVLIDGGTPDADGILEVSDGGSAAGTLRVTGGRTVTFEPVADYCNDGDLLVVPFRIDDTGTTDSQSTVYQLSINVACLGDAPGLDGDAGATVDEDLSPSAADDVWEWAWAIDPDSDATKIYVVALSHFQGGGQTQFGTGQRPGESTASRSTWATANGGTLTIEGLGGETGRIRYTPAAGYCGSDSYDVTLRNGANAADVQDEVEDIHSVPITVTCQNDTPIAKDDAAAEDEDTPFVLPVVLGGAFSGVADTDVDGAVPASPASFSALSIQAVAASPPGITVTTEGTQGLRITPEPDFCGTVDPFTYTVQDGVGATSVGTVHITITCVNDPPVLATSSTLRTVSTIDEDMTDPAGVLVSAILDGAMSDPDSKAGNPVDPPTSQGIIWYAAGIEARPGGQGNGAWQFSTDAGTTWRIWTSVQSVADANPGAVFVDSANDVGLLLRAEDMVRFRPDGENGLTASMFYAAWDQTAGEAGQTMSALFVAGGSLSEADDSVDFIVTDVNDAPILADRDYTAGAIAEDTTEGDAPHVTVSAFLVSGGADSGLTDVDIGSSQGILVIGLDTAGIGMWQMSRDPANGPWSPLADPSTGSGILLRGADGLRFIPDNAQGGTASLLFCGWDQTDPGDLDARVDHDAARAGAGGPHTDSSAFSSFCDTATLSVVDFPDPPVPGADVAATTEDTSGIVLDVLANDVDPDGDVVSIDGVSYTSDPARGTLSIVGTESTQRLFYQPLPDVCGDDVFSYDATDGQATVSATVTIEVACVDDPPQAGKDALTASEDIVRTILFSEILGNDVNGDQEDRSGAPAQAGDVVFGAETLALTYLLPLGSTTCDTDPAKAVAIDDASLTTTGMQTTLGVFHVRNLGGDPSDDALEYTPLADYFGQEPGVCYRMDEVSTLGIAATSIQVITLTIQPVDDPPNASDDGTPGSPAVTISEGTSIDLIAAASPYDNDDEGGGLYLDGDDLFIIDGSAASGTDAVSVAVSTSSRAGSLVYTPAADFFGDDIITYTLSDSMGTSEARIFVRVTDVNDPPVARDDAVTMQEDTTVDLLATSGTSGARLILLNDDSGVDEGNGETLTVVDIMDVLPAGATATLDTAAKRLDYTPPADFFGTGSLTYVLRDSGGATATAAVTITVENVNDPPVARTDTVAVTEDVVTQVLALANDDVGRDVGVAGDSPGVGPDSLSILSVGACMAGTASRGTLSITDGGHALLFDPSPSPDQEHRVDDVTCSYILQDGNGGTSSAIIDLRLQPVNDAPVLAPHEPAHRMDPITEDHRSEPGITVGAILAGQLSDPDIYSGTPAQGIAIHHVGATGGGGSWQFQTAGASGWRTIVSDNPSNDPAKVGLVTDSVIVLAPDDRVRFLPGGWNAAEASIGYVGWDQTDGHTSGTVVAGIASGPDRRGAGTAYSLASDTLGITATAVNDAPVLEDRAYTVSAITEDDTAGSVQHFLVSDILASGGTQSGLSDEDIDATQGIVLIGLDADGAGTWQVSRDPTNGPWSVITDASPTEGLRLRSVDAIRFVPATSIGAAPTFAFAGWDQSDAPGDLDQRVDVSQSRAASQPRPADTSPFSAHTEQIILTVESEPDPPVAVDDLAATTEDTISVRIDVLANDSDGDGDALTIATVSSAKRGVATITTLTSGRQVIDYAPTPGVCGTEAFQYRASDGRFETPATVTVSVACVDDAAIAVPDLLAGTEDSHRDIIVDNDLVLNDRNGDIQDQPDQPGDPSFGAARKEVTHVMAVAGGVCDTDNMIARTDGSLATTGLDLSVGVLRAIDAGFRLTPVTHFNSDYGVASFCYRMSDGPTWTTDARVDVAFAPVNDAPVAMDDGTAGTPYVRLDEDTNVDLLGAMTCGTTGLSLNQRAPFANDHPGGTPFLDLDTLRIGITSPTVSQQGGTVSVSRAAAGACHDTFIYTPPPDFFGIDVVTYVLDDGVTPVGDLPMARITLEVMEVNDPPIVRDEAFVATEDRTIDLLAALTRVGGKGVLANDDSGPDDPETLSISAASVMHPSGSTLVIDRQNPGDVTDDRLLFLAPPDYFGPAEVCYTVSDGRGGEASGCASLHVYNVNDDPVARDDVASVTEDIITKIDVMKLGTTAPGHDDADVDALVAADPPGDPPDVLTVSAAHACFNSASQSRGLLTVASDGLAVFYDPSPTAAQEHNLDSVTCTYTLSDGNGGTSVARLFISMVPDNDAPVLADQDARLPTITEDDVSTTSNPGITVGRFIHAGTVTDVDSGSQLGILLTTGSMVGGTGHWQFSADGAAWTTIGRSAADGGVLVASGQGLPLTPDHHLRFLPDERNGATASLTFCAWDRTEGGEGYEGPAGTVGVPMPIPTPRGGTTPVSQFCDIMHITVLPVNDAPTLDDRDLVLPTISEDSVLGSPSEPAGIPVMDLLGGLADVDFDPPGQGIAIYEARHSCTADCRWQVSHDGGTTWTTLASEPVDARYSVGVMTVAVTRSYLAAADDRVRFLPDGENGDKAAAPPGGPPSLCFFGWDRFPADGTVGTFVDATTRGTTRAFSLASDCATVSILDVNDPPQAIDDGVQADEDATTVLDLLNNDIDVDLGDSLRIVQVTRPLDSNGEPQGELVRHDTHVEYIAQDNYGSGPCATGSVLGPDCYDLTFTYTIADQDGVQSMATVYLKVNDIPEAPTGYPDQATVPEGSGGNRIEVLRNDFDPDGDALFIASLRSVDESGVESLDDGHTATLVDGNTVVRFSPRSGFSGTVVFEYELSDGHPDTENMFVRVTVNVEPDEDGTAPDTGDRRVSTPYGSVGVSDGSPQASVLGNQLV